MTQSVLVGNGIDIQIGGTDFLNKWIIVRLLANAKAGKYDELFKKTPDSAPSITGDELVKFFSEMPSLANRARNGDFDSLIDKSTESEVYDALADFKAKYDKEVKSPEEIGLEDWLLLLRLFLQEQSDLLPLFKTAKQGFERVVLDAIFCNGAIQQLHKNVRRKARDFFRGFDYLFTLNYDNTLEKITGKPIYHLHGDFETKALSENPQTAYGYLRQMCGEAVYFPQKFQHCNCNAILDYSGDNKYRLATALSSVLLEFDKLKLLYNDNRDEFDLFLSSFPIEQQKIIRVGVEQNLPFGYNYHFQDMEQLTGELTIIGIAPQNDSHLFECINRSNLYKVVFYHYYPYDHAPDPVLPIRKTYEIRDVSELWPNIELQSPSYTSSTAKEFSFKALKNRAETQKFVDIFNAFEMAENAVSIEDVRNQLKSIPKDTEKSIIRMMISEMRKGEYRTSPESAEAQFKQFRKFGRTLVTSSLSPQTLYFLYISNMPKDKLKTAVKRKKRRK